MPQIVDTLPLTESITPASPQEVAQTIAEAHGDKRPVYPIGGGASLDYGLPPQREGIGLSLSGLNEIIDYPARDMTITAEAGVGMQRLAQALAAEGQQLPLDPPQAEQATLGGVVATAWCGRRRFGHGSVRDYVIGIRAIDGRGEPIRGGGAVVKNVAGYDFCKLLTGSLGQLGVITEVTFKVKPLAETSAWLACRPKSLDDIESLLADLMVSPAVPVSVELLAGPDGGEDPALGLLAGREAADGLVLAVEFEGSAAEVDWMLDVLRRAWSERGLREIRQLHDDDARQFANRLDEFSAQPGSPLVLRAAVPPGRTTQMVGELLQLDPQCSIQAHAGNGIVITKLSEFPAEGLSRTVVARLRPVAAAAGGSLTVLANPTGAENTQQCLWGPLGAGWLMQEVKRQFDPENILNPGRIVFA